MPRSVWGALLALVLASAAIAHAEPRPFQLRGGQILFSITVEGRESLALLDTAAAGSLISEALADRIGAKHRKVRGGTVGVSGKHIESRATGELTIGLADAVAVERQMRLFDSGGAFVAGGAEVIVGLDMLHDKVVAIDFDKGTIDISLSRSFKTPDRPSISFSSWAWNEPTIEVDILGRKANLRIDTAASPALHVSSFFAQKLPAGWMAGASETVVSGSDGRNIRPIASAREVTVAGATFADVPLTIGPATRLAEAVVGDGVIGIDLLKRFNLVIDFRRNRLWMTPNANFETPFRRNRLGLIANSGGRGPIRLVAPGSPADAAGFRAGEVVAGLEDGAGGIVTDLMAISDGQIVTVVMADGSRRKLTAATYY